MTLLKKKIIIHYNALINKCLKYTYNRKRDISAPDYSTKVIVLLLLLLSELQASFSHHLRYIC